MNDEAYLLKKHSLTLSDYEDQISKIEYTSIYEPFKQIKDEFGVEKSHFPAINIVFYRAIFESGIVLQPMSLVDKYFDYYKNDISVFNDYVYYINQKFLYSAVVGRILRTYPSLIRDFDFFLRLKESQCFDQVIYSCKMDIQGKDIIVRTGGKEFTISLFVDTARSNLFKKLKNTLRHHYGPNEIRVPLQLRKAVKCGDFFLYDNSYIEKIKKQIDSFDGN